MSVGWRLPGDVPANFGLEPCGCRGWWQVSAGGRAERDYKPQSSLPRRGWTACNAIRGLERPG